jgi:hypothetical protein
MRATIPAAVIAAALALAACTTNPSRSASDAALPVVDTAAARSLLSADETLRVVDFPAVGSTSLTGRVEGYKSVAYAIPVARGQQVTIELTSDSPNAHFNVQDPVDGKRAVVFNGNFAGRVARLQPMEEDVTYVVRPFQQRATARRGESFDYTLVVDRR